MRIFCFLIILLLPSVAMSQLDFNPERISKTASFTVNGRIENVFPLFGPIREKEWAEGWSPEIIFSESKAVEEHMIFQTKGSGDEQFYNWVVTQYDEGKYLVEYTVSTANRIWFIQVHCQSAGDKTKVSVTYTYTGLNPKGNELNRNAISKMFATDLQDWRHAINYYLKNGKMLTSD